MSTFIVFPNNPSIYLAYEEVKGSEPTIVFLPGLRSDKEGNKAMALQEYCVKKGRSYLRFDYFGHGRSSGEFSETTIKDWYMSLEILLKKLEIQHPILVGSSLGGWIGLSYAHRNPQNVRGFVGIASAVQFTDAIFEGLSKEGKEEFRQKGYVEIPSDYEEGPYKITEKMVEDGKLFRLFDREVNIDCPIRLLHGLNDIDIPPPVSKKILNHVNAKDKDLKLVAKADHRFSDNFCMQIIFNTIDSIS